MLKRKEYTLSNKEEEWEVKRFIPLAECSIENPIVIDDYPYGFNKRCTIKYYVESKKNQGYRFVSQTFFNNRWNAPKKGIYKNFIIVYEMINGHIQADMVHTAITSLDYFVEIENEIWEFLNDIQKNFVSSCFKALKSSDYQREYVAKWYAENPTVEFTKIVNNLGGIK